MNVATLYALSTTMLSRFRTYSFTGFRGFSISNVDMSNRTINLGNQIFFPLHAEALVWHVLSY